MNNTANRCFRKSLGTIPIANDLMKREEFTQSKMIVLTPLLTFESIFDSILHSSHEGLLVIGDKDHQYNADQVNQLYKTNLTIDVIKNANHSVNVGEYETENSIEAIANIIEKLQEVVRKNNLSIHAKRGAICTSFTLISLQHMKQIIFPVQRIIINTFSSREGSQNLCETSWLCCKYTFSFCKGMEHAFKILCFRNR